MIKITLKNENFSNSGRATQQKAKHTEHTERLKQKNIKYVTTQTKFSCYINKYK